MPLLRKRGMGQGMAAGVARENVRGGKAGASRKVLPAGDAPRALLAQAGPGSPAQTAREGAVDVPPASFYGDEFDEPVEEDPPEPRGKAAEIGEEETDQ